MSVEVITATTHQYPGQLAVRGELLHLDQPLRNVLETHLVGHVEHDDDPQRSSVAAGEDRSVPLLASGVPHLDLDFLVVDDVLPRPDVHPDGGYEVVCAGVIKELV